MNSAAARKVLDQVFIIIAAPVIVLVAWYFQALWVVDCWHFRTIHPEVEIKIYQLMPIYFVGETIPSLLIVFTSRMAARRFGREFLWFALFQPALLIFFLKRHYLDSTIIFVFSLIPAVISIYAGYRVKRQRPKD